jgi:hypothetical protein
MSATRVLVLAVLLVAGCARRQHIIEGYGASYHAAFGTQAPDRSSGPARAAPGLDSQEASIIAETYRKSLAPEDQTAKEQPVLIVAPPSREQRPQLAPSVPAKER